MLQRSARLRRPEFTTCFDKGRRRHFAHMTVIYLPQETFKVSVVVSKKVAKKAHDRNRIRRRTYALLCEYSKTGRGWYIVVVKPTLARLSRVESRKVLQAEIAQGVNPQ